MREFGLLGQLMQGLRCLPGVGPKTAQRMAFHLLQRDRHGAMNLAETLVEAVQRIGHCQHCRTLTEDELCSICSDSARDQSVLCVVESPADVMVIDQATVFRGVFFVLHGHLSPLDGIGPEELGMQQLQGLLKSGELNELILATNATVEGEATALFVSEMAQSHGVRVTRIAHGVPLGGELEYVDSGTLLHAFSGRKEF
ncbi:MAG: recombination mediator RecR [Methylococcales bacterium]|nr:recombination mediator RecR [Methylococcales bacterium]